MEFLVARERFVAFGTNHLVDVQLTFGSLIASVD